MRPPNNPVLESPRSDLLAIRHFVALYRDETPRVVLAVDRVNSERAVLKWRFVAESDRRKGLGSSLVDRTIGFAEGAGYDRLVLGTMTQMESAHRLYEKKEFVYKEQVKFWRRPLMIYERSLRQNGGRTRRAPGGAEIHPDEQGSQ